MKINPIKAWLVRVTTECGSPENMLKQAESIKNENTRRLIIERAQLWKREIKLGNAK